MRPENWPSLLDAYIEGARSDPFDWGRNDCVTFSCNWFGLMTGNDPAEKFRNEYSTEREALEIMIRHGVKGMEGAGWFLFGVPDDHVLFVGRGDIVFGKGALGICLGAKGAFLTNDGLTFHPADDFELFWKV